MLLCVPLAIPYSLRCLMTISMPNSRLPSSRRTLLPCGWYQIILLGDRGTCLQTTYCYPAVEERPIVIWSREPNRRLNNHTTRPQCCQQSTDDGRLFTTMTVYLCGVCRARRADQSAPAKTCYCSRDAEYAQTQTPSLLYLL